MGPKENQLEVKVSRGPSGVVTGLACGATLAVVKNLLDVDLNTAQGISYSLGPGIGFTLVNKFGEYVPLGKIGKYLKETGAGGITSIGSYFVTDTLINLIKNIIH